MSVDPNDASNPPAPSLSTDELLATIRSAVQAEVASAVGRLASGPTASFAASVPATEGSPSAGALGRQWALGGRFACRRLLCLSLIASYGLDPVSGVWFSAARTRQPRFFACRAMATAANDPPGRCPLNLLAAVLTRYPPCRAVPPLACSQQFAVALPISPPSPPLHQPLLTLISVTLPYLPSTPPLSFPHSPSLVSLFLSHSFLHYILACY